MEHDCEEIDTSGILKELENLIGDGTLEEDQISWENCRVIEYGKQII